MINDEVADLIVREMQPIPLPNGSLIKAFHWSHVPTRQADCPVLRNR